MTPLADGAPRETFISVDVETAGPSPTAHALLSIGACVVDDPSSGLYIELRPDREGSVPEALAVSGLSTAELSRSGTDPAAAMARFADWVDAVTPAGATAVFVGFNAGFDWMFVADYFQRYLGRNPFGHAPLDIKSYAMGLLGCSWRDTSMRRLAPLFLSGRELSHNALEDARDQAELFQALRARAGEGTHDEPGGAAGR
ncbi:3'-5' exonuclease [Microbacter sp. GSS18]|nr:3'-5' exonuclease [Microbacter sp. GSS18]